MLALGAHWCELADIFYGEQSLPAASSAQASCRRAPQASSAADRGAEAKTHQNSRPVSLLRTKMGLKFNFKRIPLHWRLLVGLQLGISGAIMMYRQRVLAVKAKQQE